MSTAYVSPLAHQDYVQVGIHELPSSDEQAILERDFINDAIKTHNYCYPRKVAIIPHYEPLLDKECKKYFESKMVQDVIEKTLTDKELPPKKTRTWNKLSVRKRCPPTPPPEELESLEQQFINDAIVTEKQRTKYNDTLLVKYDGELDRHSSSYFYRPDVQTQLNEKKFREFVVTSFRHRPLTPLTPRSQDRKHPRSGLYRSSTFSYDEIDTSRHRGKKGVSCSYDSKSSHKPRSDGNPGAHPHSNVSQSYPEVPLAENLLINKLSFRRIAMPSPASADVRERERNFVNDAIKTEKNRTKYKDTLIPKYDGKEDAHAKGYHKRQDVQSLTAITCTLKPYDTEDRKMATSIEGPVMDRFHETGAGARYVSLRNQFGAGHSREYIDGHAQFMQGIKPTTGYHGPYGFRRNTPWLRASPSPFGTSTLSSTH